MAKKEKKKYRFEDRMLKEDILWYEDIAINEIDHRCKDNIRISNGSMVVAVVIKLSTIELNYDSWGHDMCICRIIFY